MSAEEFHRILVPVDGSEHSFRAASYAIKMAKEYGAELILVYVPPVIASLQLLGVYGTSRPESIEERVNAAKAEASPWFERIEREAKVAGVNMAKNEVIEGPLSTVGEIVQYAEENKVDLIVIGSRGRTGFKKLILGSVASGVVTYASCNVLVVK